MSTFSYEQQICFDKYLKGENLFITGPGGTGKSFLIKNIVADAEEKKKIIKVCALTGCAAILLQCKATTLHMFSGIGLANKKNALIVEELFTKKRHKLKNWRGLEILIIDEVSMMSLKILLLLDLIARKFYKKNVPFGGLQVIFTGDFYQLSPVFSNCSEKEQEQEKETSMYCFQYELWDQLFIKENQIVRGSACTVLVMGDGSQRHMKTSTFDPDGAITQKAKTLVGSKIRTTCWDPKGSPGRWSSQGYFRNVYSAE